MTDMPDCCHWDLYKEYWKNMYYTKSKGIFMGSKFHTGKAKANLFGIEFATKNGIKFIETKRIFIRPV